jgi:hypothetical protein
MQGVLLPETLSTYLSGLPGSSTPGLVRVSVSVQSGCLPVHLANGGRHTEIQELLRDRALSCTIDFKYKEGGDW